MQTQRISTSYLHYVFAFCLCFLLCRLFPYTGDDWIWGSQTGIARLQKAFAAYNGRYLGNYIVLALTRSVLLRSACMAAALCGICAAVRQIVGASWAFWLAALLLFCVPKQIGAQAIVWTAGFSNYTVAGLLSLLYLVYLTRQEKRDKGFHRILSCAALFLLGFASCLVLENVTVATLLLSAVVLVWRMLRRQRFRAPLTCHTIGSLLGTVLMFSNSAYRNVWNQSDSYRSALSGGLLQQCRANYLEAIYPYGYFLNIVLNLALFFCCLVAFFLLRKRIRGVLLRCSLAVQGAFAFYALFTALMMPEGKSGIFQSAEALFCFAALLASFCTIALLVHAAGERARWEKCLFCMASVVLLIAPLFIVNPVTPRCFFPSYLYFVLLLCLVAELCASLLSERAAQGTEEGKEDFQVLGRLVRRGLLLTLTGLFVLYLGVFFSVYRADQRRLAYIQTAVSEGREQAAIVHLPYEDFLTNPTPPDEAWAKHYKAFHGLPMELRLEPSYGYPAE